jgi:antitoxin (DNA-binding transcriptional repressor) of toxin-antitoxin stability system
MKTMTIRDVRQHWPVAEQALETEREIIITRDGKPVARLLPVHAEEAPATQFDPGELNRWREETFGKGTTIDSMTRLLQDREERKLI